MMFLCSVTLLNVYLIEALPGKDQETQCLRPFWEESLDHSTK